MSDDHACRLFIEAEWTLDELLEMIEEQTGGERSRRTIMATDFAIDVESSSEADSRKVGDEDGFLFYRFGAYVEPKADHVPNAYVDSLSQLIVDLRSEGALVVASCDFEAEIAVLTGWNWSTSTPKHP